MGKTNLETFKMSKTQMNYIIGGYDESTCRRLQEMANGDESADWTAEQWDSWAVLWEKNCSK